MTLRPIALRPDNFTPPSRTPWGGRRLGARYKAPLGAPTDQPIGESWELSTGPEFPSSTADGVALRDLVASDPLGMLGSRARSDENCLLVKWIDAAEDLSLQVHPPDDYPALAADESGKPECWYVVEHAAGAGLYVGLSQGVSQQAMQDALRSGQDIATLLCFWEVAAGDFVLLPPGTPHAIGAGVLLVEAQRVLPGRRGVTYRYWDWQRRYDASGRRDDRGQPRPLHVEHALAVTQWTQASDRAWLQRHRARLGGPELAAPARCDTICGPPSAKVASAALRVARASGSGLAQLPAWDALSALTVIEGEVCIGGVLARAGQTLALPAALGGAELSLTRGHALITAAYPP